MSTASLSPTTGKRARDVYEDVEEHVLGPALLAAVRYGDVRSAADLIARGVDVNAPVRVGRPRMSHFVTPLASAIAVVAPNYLEMINLLLEHNASIEPPTPKSKRNNMSALQSAVSASRGSVVLRLLQETPNLELRDEDTDFAVIHRAAVTDHVPVLAMLLDRGVDVDSRAREVRLSTLQLHPYVPSSIPRPTGHASISRGPP